MHNGKGKKKKKANSSNQHTKCEKRKKKNMKKKDSQQQFIVTEIKKISRNDETTRCVPWKNKNQLIFGRRNVQ